MLRFTICQLFYGRIQNADRYSDLNFNFTDFQPFFPAAMFALLETFVYNNLLISTISFHLEQFNRRYV